MTIQEAPEQTLTDTISEAEYLEAYAAHFYEFVDGELIKMSPITMGHLLLTNFFYMLLNAYFEIKPIGVVVTAPFTLKMPSGQYREPDLQVILKTNPGALTPTGMHGAADICIEVVLEESIERDHGTKFREYQEAGVNEYWIIDPLRDETRFYRLNDEQIYIPQKPNTEGIYETPNLPGLKLHVPTLWEAELPGPIAIGQMMREMLG